MESSYALTEEGKKYLREGLPERNLLDFLKSRGGEASLEEAKQHVENLSIALQWCLKRGWVKLENETIKLLRCPEEIPEEKALEIVAEGGKPGDESLKTLFFRKLVKKVKVGAEKLKELEGKEITHLTPELIKLRLWRKVRFKPYNVEVPGRRIFPGKRHPYLKFLSEVRRKLVELGFEEMEGPVIETEFWNYDALFQPQDHPARDWWDTYQLKFPKYGDLPEVVAERVKEAHEKGVAGSKGWGYRWDPRKAMQLMPRAHGTCLSARTLVKGPKIPGKYFAIVRCYRPDVIDATHGVEFNQVEGIVLGEGLSFRELLGILKTFAEEIANAEKVKFIPDYYPFTEPSVQLSAKHPELGWMEFGGAGIFREEVTIPLGVNVPVLAWGLGIDRLAMFKLGISDIRELFTRNLEWLRNFPVSKTSL